jgi:hypothetical protein
MSPFLAVLFILGGSVCVVERWERYGRRGLHRAVVEGLSAYLVLLTLISILLLVCGTYTPRVAYPLAAAATLVVAAIRGRPGRLIEVKGVPRVSSWLLMILLLFAFPFVEQRYEYFELTGDAGVYSTAAMHFLTEGRLQGTLPVPAELPEELQRNYIRDNYFWRDPVTGKGNLLPGVYADPSREWGFYFQFYPAWPLLMADWAAIVGIPSQHSVMLPLYFLSLALLHLILHDLGVRILPTISICTLFAFSPVLVYFSKYPTSELFLLFLMLLTFYWMMLPTRKEHAVYGGLSFSLFCLSHISSFIYLPIVLVSVVATSFKTSEKIPLFGLVALSGFLSSIPYGFYVSRQYFVDIYSENFAFFGTHAVLYGVSLVLAAALTGIGLCGYLLVKRSDSKTGDE